jgi:hypothetical protein
MNGAGLEMACRTEEDWVRLLEYYMLDEEARREAGQRGKVFADQAYSEEGLLEKWDHVFESLFQ